MKTATGVLAWMAACGLAGTALAGEMKVVAVADSVNLRAKPDIQSETVAQISQGDSLTAKSIREEWVEVVPPAKVDMWVNKDFVKDNLITPSKINVRAGAGVAYNIVGVLARGTVVQPRGEFSEWIKIAPLTNMSLWVSKSLVRVEESNPVPPAPPPEKVPKAAAAPAAPEPAVTNITPPVVVPVPPARAPDLPAEKKIVVNALPPEFKLVPLEGQGRMLEFTGEIRSTGLFTHSPSPYRLVSYEGNELVTLCYLWANEEQLREFKGRTMKLRGRQYWIQGYRLPLVAVDEMLVQPVK